MTNSPKLAAVKSTKALDKYSATCVGDGLFRAYDVHVIQGRIPAKITGVDVAIVVLCGVFEIEIGVGIEAQNVKLWFNLLGLYSPPLAGGGIRRYKYLKPGCCFA